MTKQSNFRAIINSVITCPNCEKHLRAIRYLENQLDEKANRLATVLYEKEQLQRELDKYKNKISIEIAYTVMEDETLNDSKL